MDHFIQRGFNLQIGLFYFFRDFLLFSDFFSFGRVFKLFQNCNFFRSLKLLKGCRSNFWVSACKPYCMETETSLGKGYLTAFKNLWSYLGLEGKKCQTFFQELNWLFESLHQQTVTAITSGAKTSCNIWQTWSFRGRPYFHGSCFM